MGMLKRVSDRASINMPRMRYTTKIITKIMAGDLVSPLINSAIATVLPDITSSRLNTMVPTTSKPIMGTVSPVR